MREINLAELAEAKKRHEGDVAKVRAQSNAEQEALAVKAGPSRAQRRAMERRKATRERKQARREREVAALTRNLTPAELEELDGFLAEQGVQRRG